MRTLLATVALGVAATSAHAAEGGMPQLDFANPLTIAQVVWLSVIFLALYLMLSRSALPEIAGILEKRAAHIAEDLEKARQSKAAADGAVAELDRAMRESHARAHAEIAQATAAAKEAAGKHAAELEARLERQIAEAEQRIAAARQSAMGALEQVATDAALAMVGRLTGAPPNQEVVRRDVAGALASWRAGQAEAA
jgi:F-type H+-transporting ATPase subunit b